MAKATLAQIYARIAASLEALGPNGSGAFRVVTEFGGQVTQETISQVTQGRFPAALLAFAGEESAQDLDSLTHEQRVVMRVRHVVYVVVQSIRGAKPAHDGSGGTMGLHALADAVCAQIYGAYLPGLHGTRRVHYAGAVPTLFVPGNTGSLVVYALRFWADRQLVASELPDDAFSPQGAPAARPLHRIDMDVSSLPSTPADTAARPITQARADNLDD